MQYKNIPCKLLFVLLINATLVEISVQFPEKSLLDILTQARAEQTPTAVTEPKIGSSNATVSQTNTKKRTCACDDDTVGVNPICANNGVTYKNTCRFDCAKARVTRLRVVRTGQCSQTAGTGAYWQKQG